MSGHSKWANIKRDKGINDAKRGKLFTKVGRLITVAARQGGGDIDMNPTLRLAVEKAKDARMPKETIDRAIQRGMGKGDEGNLEEVVYEGFGPKGEAFFVKGITDNRNRTVAEIRMIMNKHGGSLGGSGSTSYIFSTDPKNPAFLINVPESEKANLANLCEQLEDHDDVQEVYFNFKL